LTKNRREPQDGVSRTLTEKLLFFPPQEYDNYTYTYCTAIADFLCQVRNWSQQERPKERITKVLLTGGAARMDFVQEAVTKVFGMEPLMQMERECSVARGLALCGRAEVLGARFSRDVRQEFQAIFVAN